jgi:hypothetical protein
MQLLEVSCAVRPIYGSLGAKGLMMAVHSRSIIGYLMFLGRYYGMEMNVGKKQLVKYSRKPSPVSIMIHK